MKSVLYFRGRFFVGGRLFVWFAVMGGEGQKTASLILCFAARGPLRARPWVPTATKGQMALSNRTLIPAQGHMPSARSWPFSAYSFGPAKEYAEKGQQKSMSYGGTRPDDLDLGFGKVFLFKQANRGVSAPHTDILLSSQKYAKRLSPSGGHMSLRWG